MSDATKWKVLGGLALLWGLVVILQISGEPDQKRVPLTYQSGQGNSVDRGVSGSSRPTLLKQMSLKNKKGPTSLEPTQNIFAALEFPKPKKKKVKRVIPPPPPPPRPAAVPPPPPPPPSPLDLAAAQARKKMAQYRFLGYLTEGGLPRAFLVKGQDIFILRPGEGLGGGIRVASIEPSAVTLEETRTHLQATLPLTKTDGGLLGLGRQQRR